MSCDKKKKPRSVIKFEMKMKEHLNAWMPFYSITPRKKLDETLNLTQDELIHS